MVANTKMMDNHHPKSILRIGRPTSSSGNKIQRSGVIFADVTVYEFPIQIGDNPSVSTGCPIQIGWKHVSKEVRNLEVFEFCKRDESTKVLKIPPETRGQLLLGAGYSLHAIAKAALKAEMAKEERMETLRKHGWDRMVTVLEQTGKLPKGIMKAALGTTGDILSTTGDLVLATGGLLANTGGNLMGSAGRQLSKTFGNSKPKNMPARSA